MRMEIPVRYSRYRRYALTAIMSWVLVSSMFMLLADLLVVPFTRGGNWAGLEIAESYLTPVCHRMPSRSFWLFEVPLGLCARCTGIYLGLVIGLVLSFAMQGKMTIPFRAAVTLILLALLDGSIQHFHVYDSGNLARAMTGFAYGIGLALLFHFFLQRERHLFDAPYTKTPPFLLGGFP